MSAGVPREKALLCEALEIADPEQRRLVLAQACGADNALREQVEALLALSADDFFRDCGRALEQAVADVDPAQQLLADEFPESRRIGAYKLLQKLGEGGCGVVYMASQEEPIRRRMALKLIKPGMDSREIIARDCWSLLRICATLLSSTMAKLRTVNVPKSAFWSVTVCSTSVPFPPSMLG